MHSGITVVIPTYQRPHLLRNCLQALAQQNLSYNQFSVTVVDDANDPQTVGLLQEFSLQTGLAIQYIGQPQRRGPAAARNAGWQSAQTPYIAFTDDDCLPQPDWLPTALSLFEQGASVITGSVQMPLPDQPTLHDRTTALLETAEFVTANLFCRWSVLERVGGFDENFDIAWREDSDLHFRIIEAGIPIISCPEAVIVHPIRQAPWYASLCDERKNRYDALLYKRHPTLFRQRIPTYKPLVRHYYGAVLAVGLGAVGLLAENKWVTITGLSLWIVLTVPLIRKRLTNQDRSMQSFRTALLTSLATPFLSVYWRLYGAINYRVWYW